MMAGLWLKEKMFIYTHFQAFHLQFRQRIETGQGPFLLIYDSDQLVLADLYSSVRVQHLSKHSHLFY